MPSPNSEDSSAAQSFCKTLETDFTLGDAREGLRIERAIRARLRIPVVQRLADRSGIKSLAHQKLLLLLEGLGRIEGSRDADEQRLRISRQPPRQMGCEIIEVEAIGGDDRRHAGAAVMA